MTERFRGAKKFLWRFRTSIPSIPGIERSRRTRSKRSCSRRSRVSRPFAAKTVLWSRRPSHRSRSSRLPASSSTASGSGKARLFLPQKRGSKKKWTRAPSCDTLVLVAARADSGRSESLRKLLHGEGIIMAEHADVRRELGGSRGFRLGERFGRKSVNERGKGRRLFRRLFFHRV